MKKTVLLASLLLSSAATYASPCCPPQCPFTGFYIGSEIGLDNHNLRTTLSESYISDNEDDLGTDNFIDHQQKSHHETDYLLGVFAGYGASANCFYWGAEINSTASFNDKRYQESYVAVDDLTYDFNTRVRRGAAFGLAARLGYVYNCNWLFYVKPGVQWTDTTLEHFALANSQPAVDPLAATEYSSSGEIFEKKRTITSFVPAIGIERQYCNFVWRLEYGYDFGGKINQEAKYNQFGVSEIQVDGGESEDGATLEAFTYTTTDTKELKTRSQYLALGVYYIF